MAKLDAGQGETELSNDLLVGAALFERAATGVPRARRDPLLAAAAALRSPGDPVTRTALALRAGIDELLAEYPLRDLVTRGDQYGVWVDRPLARFSSWYEMFPRSTGGLGRRGQPGARHVRHRGRRSFRASRQWDSTSCTCRRSIRSARYIARAATTLPPPPPATWARRGRSAATRAATTPSTRTWAPSTTSTPSSPRRASWAWRWRWTWRCSARPTTRGRATTASGSPNCPTAPSPTRRTRRRSTRTSIR